VCGTQTIAEGAKLHDLECILMNRQFRDALIIAIMQYRRSFLASRQSVYYPLLDTGISNPQKTGP